MSLRTRVGLSGLITLLVVSALSFGHTLDPLVPQLGGWDLIKGGVLTFAITMLSTWRM
jgi:hypothetical protein